MHIAAISPISAISAISPISPVSAISPISAIAVFSNVQLGQYAGQYCTEFKKLKD